MLRYIPRWTYLVPAGGILVGGGLLALLIPNPTGVGTHTQLGLPPCPWLLLTAHRCPACGLTTSLTHLLHGDLVAAFQAHPFGPLMAILLVGLFSASLYGCWRPFRWRALFRPWGATRWGRAGVGLLITAWVITWLARG